MTRNQKIFQVVFMISVVAMGVGSLREPFDFQQMLLFFITALFSAGMYIFNER